MIEVLRADLLEGAALRIFAPPAQWVRWQTLPARLGGLPMAVPVPLGGDPDALAAELDAVWAAQHAQAATATSPLGPGWAAGARPGLLETVVSVDASLSPSGLSEGDVALLVDPGVPASPLDGGRPRSVLRAVRLDHYRDGLLGVRAEPGEWVWWRSLPQRLGSAPMLLGVHPGTDVGEISADLNDSWRSEWEQQR